MTPNEKNTITTMRRQGCSYAQIARELDINENTVKTFCRRNGLKPEMPEPEKAETI